jgi:putative ABC transport system substrate-binding protein
LAASTAHRRSPATAHRHLEHRVRAQAVAVIGVFVARRDRKHPQPQHLDDLVIDPRGIAPVHKATRQPLGETEAPLNLAQQKDAAIRRQATTVESDGHLPAANSWQEEGEKVIIVHVYYRAVGLTEKNMRASRDIWLPPMDEAHCDREGEGGIPAFGEKLGHRSAAVYRFETARVGRRDLLAMLGGAMVAMRAAAAEGAAPARIGFVSGNDEGGAVNFVAALRDGLAAEGYREPDTLNLDLLYADNALERVPALVAELERRRVELIVTHAAATPIVVKAERKVPVVYEFSADPVATGIAADLAHPLFNATGITLMRAELNGKRLELLHEIAPEVRRVAVIANPLHAGEAREQADLEAKAEQLGIHISFFATPNRGELDRALDAIRADPPQALVAFSEGFVVENRDTIISFAMSRRLPVVSGWAVMAKSGALFTYGPRLVESYRRAAYFVGRILKGAKPAELPIEQPTVLELVINLKSAKALGLGIPPTVLTRADEVIE